MRTAIAFCVSCIIRTIKLWVVNQNAIFRETRRPRYERVGRGFKRVRELSGRAALVRGRVNSGPPTKSGYTIIVVYIIIYRFGSTRVFITCLRVHEYVSLQNIRIKGKTHRERE